MDSIVQFARNFLCCVKDLKLLPNSFIHTPIPEVLKSAFNYDLNIPSPLHLTTPLEFIICFTQFYAHYTCTKSGYNLIQSGFAKLHYMNHLINIRKKQSNSSSSQKKKDKLNTTQAEKIIDEKLTCEKNGAIKDIVVGVCVFPIGICFFWLFANSLHITSTDWIGGLPAVMLALAIMEVVLIPLLYYMARDGNKQLSDSSEMKLLAKDGSWKSRITENEFIDLTLFGYLLPDYNFFWSNHDKHWSIQTDIKFVQQQFTKEMKQIQNSINNLKDSDEKQMKTLNEKLKHDSSNARLLGWREYIYFLLNFLAFYGYLLNVIVYLWNDEDNEPYVITNIKMGMTNQDADWRGNFLGDFMWTIEPVVALSSPFMFGMLLPKDLKVKSD